MIAKQDCVGGLLWPLLVLLALVEATTGPIQDPTSNLIHDPGRSRKKPQKSQCTDDKKLSKLCLSEECILAASTVLTSLGMSTVQLTLKTPNYKQTVLSFKNVNKQL